MKIFAKRFGMIFGLCVVILLIQFYLVQNFKIPEEENYSQKIFNSIPTSNIVLEEISASENRWYLKIPKIQLEKNIQEGTSQSVMKKAIGHFQETPSWNRKCRTCSP